MSEFWEQYKKPEWQRRRLEVMQRADFKCEECNSKDETLSVHHTYYIRGRKPWEYDPSSLKCLCKSCHDKRHNVADALKDVLSSLSQQQIEWVLGYAVGHVMSNRFYTTPGMSDGDVEETPYSLGCEVTSDVIYGLARHVDGGFGMTNYLNLSCNIKAEGLLYRFIPEIDQLNEIDYAQLYFKANPDKAIPEHLGGDQK